MATPDWTTTAKARMRDLGLRQDDLRAALGVKTRGAVGHYLAGRRQPTPAQLLALAKKCRIGVDELLTGSTSKQYESRTDEYSSAVADRPGNQDYNLDADVIEEILDYVEIRRDQLGNPHSTPRQLAQVLTQLYPEFKADKELEAKKRRSRHAQRINKTMEGVTAGGAVSTTTTKRTEP